MNPKGGHKILGRERERGGGGGLLDFKVIVMIPKGGHKILGREREGGGGGY